jgi:hypothetical protein
LSTTSNPPGRSTHLEIRPPSRVLRTLGIKEDQIKSALSRAFEHAARIIVNDRNVASKTGAREVRVRELDLVLGNLYGRQRAAERASGACELFAETKNNSAGTFSGLPKMTFASSSPLSPATESGLREQKYRARRCACSTMHPQPRASARIAGKPVIGKLIKGAQGLNQNSRLE